MALASWLKSEGQCWNKCVFPDFQFFLGPSHTNLSYPQWYRICRALRRGRTQTGRNRSAVEGYNEITARHECHGQAPTFREKQRIAR